MDDSVRFFDDVEYLVSVFCADLRLVRYTYYLLERYYAVYDELCFSTGQALLRYVQGDESQKTLVETLDNERKKYDKLFFGY